MDDFDLFKIATGRSCQACCSSLSRLLSFWLIGPIVADASALLTWFLLGRTRQSIHLRVIQKDPLRIGLAACADVTFLCDVLMDADSLHIVFVYPRPLLCGDAVFAVVVRKGNGIVAALLFCPFPGFASFEQTLVIEDFAHVLRAQSY
jgi:hypothetical protein